MALHLPHITQTNGAIHGKFNFGKYNIFHIHDEVTLFAMVKACLQLKKFVLFRALENFVLLIHCSLSNEVLDCVIVSIVDLFEINAK